MFLIGWPGVSCESEVVSPLSAFPLKKVFEPAGRAFEDLWLLQNTQIGHSVSQSSKEGSGSGSSGDLNGEDDSDDELPVWEEESIHRMNFDGDAYQSLGIAHLRFRATKEQIRKAYQRLVVWIHPDKGRCGEEEAFQKVQNQYEILSSNELRVSYDSRLCGEMHPQNVALVIPEDIETDEEFYAQLRPSFENLAYWSAMWKNREIDSVPQLGDENSRKEDVESFYSFWKSFESWRDFSHELRSEEEDKDKELQFEDRRERREYQRAAERHQKKRSAQERRRLRAFVDAVYKLDPRIARWKCEAAIQAEKEEEERKEREAEEARYAEERRLAEEAEKQRRIAEERRRYLEEKQYRKTLRRSIRQVIGDRCEGDSAFTSEVEQCRLEMEYICLKGSDEQMAHVLADASADGKRLRGTLHRVWEESGGKSASEKIKLESSSSKTGGKNGGSSETSMSKKSDADEWEESELKLLAEAFKLFPGGVRDRWEKIAAFVGTRDMRSVIQQCKRLKKGAPPPPIVRDDAHASALPTSHFPPSAPPAPTSEEDAMVKKKKKVVKKKQKKEMVPWLPDEQERLESGLRQFPGSDPERWEKITKHVGTRSKADCIQRFRELVAHFKAQKGK